MATLKNGSDSASERTGIAKVVQSNIAELYQLRREHEQSLTTFEKVANAVSQYCGTPSFIFLNALFFIVWIGLNVRAFGIKPFDPYPFGLLTTIVSLEAIFLSLFVLLSQTRMRRLADQQSELDLQVNLLTEHELTRVLVSVDLIAKHLGVHIPHKEEIEELKSDIAPNRLLEEIESVQAN